MDAVRIFDRGSALPEAADRTPEPDDPAIGEHRDLDRIGDPRVAVELAAHTPFESWFCHRLVSAARQ